MNMTAGMLPDTCAGMQTPLGIQHKMLPEKGCLQGTDRQGRTLAGAKADAGVAVAEVGRGAGALGEGRVGRVWAAIELAGQ